MVKIERASPRPGVDETPWRDSRGYYQLASPTLPASVRNKIENATYVATIEEAARLVELGGYALRMGAKGKRASLVSWRSLKVTR